MTKPRTESVRGLMRYWLIDIYDLGLGHKVIDKSLIGCVGILHPFHFGDDLTAQLGDFTSRL